MSWNASGSGTPAEVREQLSEQFAEASAGLSDEGEKQTVQKVFDLCEQILSTFDPEGKMLVRASGYAGFSDWRAQTGPYQYVTLIVSPQ